MMELSPPACPVAPEPEPARPPKPVDLIHHLRQAEYPEAARVAEALAREGHAGRPESEVALLLALNAPDSDTRRRAIWALGKWTHPSQETLASLGALMTDENPWVRAEVAETLGRIGPPAAFASTQLMVAVGADPIPAVRRWAAWALSRLLAPSQTAAGVSVLSGALLNEAEVVEVRREAAESLGRLADVCPEAVVVLRQAAHGPDREMVRLAVYDVLRDERQRAEIFAVA